jgi:3-oxoacyl-[acyl-carrier protein] reductase
MDFDFTGQTVAVTAAGSGFGRDIAASFARRGARVFASDISSHGLEETAAIAPMRTRMLDVTDRAAAQAWIREIEDATGKAVGVLVNNAGGSVGRTPANIEDVSDKDWDSIVEVNLGATFNLCRAVAPAMKHSGRGCIVNISSGAGLRASFFNIQAYGSAKHGVIGLTKILAQELGGHGITVNSVAPGFVITCERQRAKWEGYGEDGRRDLLKRIAMRRLATSQEVADAVLFFASPLGAGITGEVLGVGLTA